MNHKSWIICFGSKWANPSVYTEKHLVKFLFRKGYRILWVDPIPNRNISVTRSGSKKSLLKTVSRRLVHQFHVFSKISQSFYVFRPFFFPNVVKSESKNLRFLKLQIALIKKFLQIKNFIVISSSITDVPAVFPNNEYNKFIQISGDLYSDLREISEAQRANIKAKEKRVFNAADIILVASNTVYNKIINICKESKKVEYFPHGVDFKHFDDAFIHKDVKYLRNFNKPIAGYFGGLTHATDQEVLKKLADKNFIVVLIGPVLADFSDLKKHKNIKFIGSIDYQLLPSYAMVFDVCIMAWKPGKWIENCNPSKTFEYLSLGKPIVSVSIPELKYKLSEYILFADEPNEFYVKCKQAYDSLNEEDIVRRKEIAKQNDWEKKFNQLIKKMGL